MKKFLPVIIVVGVLVIGGLVFFSKGKQVSVPSEVGQEAPAKQEEKSFTESSKMLYRSVNR